MTLSRPVRPSALILVASALLGGCYEGTPPTAYKHPRDRFFAAVPLPFLHDDFVPCFRTTGREPARLPPSECYRLTDPRRMRGVAITGFETGAFYPGRTTLPPHGERSAFWLEHEPRLLPADVRDRCLKGCAVYLDFIGRRTAVRGSYGHMGLANHLILVDRVFEAKVVK